MLKEIFEIDAKLESPGTACIHSGMHWRWRCSMARLRLLGYLEASDGRFISSLAAFPASVSYAPGATLASLPTCLSWWFSSRSSPSCSLACRLLPTSRCGDGPADAIRRA